MVSSVIRTVLADDNDFQPVFVDPRISSVGDAALKLWRVIRFFASPGSKVVHLNTASRGSSYRHMFFAVFTRVFAVRYVIHLHGGGYRDFVASASPLVRLALCTFFERASRIVVLTPQWGEFVSEMIRRDEYKIVVIANGTMRPPTGLVPKSDVPSVIFVGRLTARKGVVDLLHALEISPVLSSTRVQLIGGQMDSQVERALTETQLNVELTGELSNREVLSLVAQAWILVLPSMAENLPMSVLEAMSVGTPVVVSRVGGLPEIVTEAEGKLFSPGDVSALSDALSTLVSDFDEVKRLGANCRRKWETQFSADVMITGLKEVWKDASRKRA